MQPPIMITPLVALLQPTDPWTPNSLWVKDTIEVRTIDLNKDVDTILKWLRNTSGQDLAFLDEAKTLFHETYHDMMLFPNMLAVMVSKEGKPLLLLEIFTLNLLNQAERSVVMEIKGDNQQPLSIMKEVLEEVTSWLFQLTQEKEVFIEIDVRRKFWKEVLEVAGYKWVSTSAKLKFTHLLYQRTRN